MLSRSPTVAFAATGSVVLSAGTDSPVSAASSVRRFLTSASRRSAGTLSPDSSSTTSPGTSSSAGIMRVSPPRRVRASADSMSRIESSAFSALPSWTNPSSPLSTTTPRMIDGVDPQPQHHLGEARAEQHVDQDVVELDRNRMNGPRLLLPASGWARTFGAGPRLRLHPGRADAGVEPPHHLVDGDSMPGSAVGCALWARRSGHSLPPVDLDRPRCPEARSRTCSRYRALGLEASVGKHSYEPPTSHIKMGRPSSQCSLASRCFNYIVGP